MCIMQPLAETAAQRFASVRTEQDFWQAFTELSRDFLAWPGGLLMLWTPTVPYALVEFGARNANLVRSYGDESIDTGMTGPILPGEMAGVRRDVRNGKWGVSWRNTHRRWHLLYDARDVPVRFTEPPQAREDLGIAA